MNAVVVFILLNLPKPKMLKLAKGTPASDLTPSSPIELLPKYNHEYPNKAQLAAQN